MYVYCVYVHAILSATLPLFQVFYSMELTVIYPVTLYAKVQTFGKKNSRAHSSK